jgi:cholesterol transport system auxiliary component
MMTKIDFKRNGPTRRSIVVTGSAFSLLFLAGCAVPGGGPAPRRIRLGPAEDFPPHIPAVGWSLLVQEPTTTLSLNTAKIAIGSANDIKYLAGGEWASRAPEMVMELLVESFTNSNKILTVGDRRARIRPNFELQLRLSAFHIEQAADESGTVRVGLETTLVQRPRRDPLASFSFESSAPVSSLALEEIVAAFEESLQEVMVQVVDWTLQAGAGA